MYTADTPPNVLRIIYKQKKNSLKGIRKTKQKYVSEERQHSWQNPIPSQMEPAKAAQLVQLNWSNLNEKEAEGTKPEVRGT